MENLVKTNLQQASIERQILELLTHSPKMNLPSGPIQNTNLEYILLLESSSEQRL
jgi:hypothetical protein